MQEPTHESQHPREPSLRHDPRARHEGLPPYAEALGYGGLAPFALLTLALWVVAAPDTQELLVRALLAYGATILSFLGAVHWGRALARPGARDAMVLAVGVLPSLVGAASLVLSPEPALVTQIVAFGAVWLYEHRVLGERFFGKPYLDLRRNLTAGVVLILLAALFGPVMRMGVHA